MFCRDILLTAYWDAFPRNNSVCLYVRASVDASNMLQYDTFRQTYAGQRGVQVNSLPRVMYLQSDFSASRMPSLYKSVDCLVLPSRGEGWGRPIFEAMAMGLPVITTNWGGATEYVDDENCFLISVDLLVEATGGPGAPHKWAQPSITHLAELMEFVTREQGTASSKGRVAMATVSERFSHEVVAGTIIERLLAMEQLLQSKSRDSVEEETASALGKAYDLDYPPYVLSTHM